jgi:hypothetical protein
MNRTAYPVLAVALLCLVAWPTHAQVSERSVGFAVQQYTPRLDASHSLYGRAVSAAFTYEYLSEKNSFIRVGVGFLKHSGNGYGRHFVDGPKANESLLPFELSIGYRVPFADGSRAAIVVGGGAQYLSYWERYPGQDRIAAQGIGGVLYIGPEFALSKRLRLGLEYRVLGGEVQARTPEGLLDIDVGGSFLQVALRRVL